MVEDESFECMRKSVSSSRGPGEESELSDSTVLVLAFLVWCVWIGGSLGRSRSAILEENEECSKESWKMDVFNYGPSVAKCKTAHSVKQ